MSDGRIEFLAELREELADAPEEGGGAAAEFARLILERLADAGYVDNPTMLWAQGTFGPARFRISGYSLSEEEERLLLVL